MVAREMEVHEERHAIDERFDGLLNGGNLRGWLAQGSGGCRLQFRRGDG